MSHIVRRITSSTIYKPAVYAPQPANMSSHTHTTNPNLNELTNPLSNFPENYLKDSRRMLDVTDRFSYTVPGMHASCMSRMQLNV